MAKNLLRKSSAKSKSGDSDRRPFWRRYARAFVVVIALGGFAGIVWYSYSQGVRDGGARALPLVRADLTPVKAAPKNPGGIVVPHKDMLIYDRLDSGRAQAPARLEHISPPEEPITLVKAEAAADKPAAPAINGSLGSRGKIEAAAPRDGVQIISPAPNGAKPPAPNGAKPVITAQYMGPFRIQLAAYRSAEVAAKRWRTIKVKHEDLLGRLNPIIQKADLGKKGLYFRLQAGPLPSRASAKSLCAALKKRKVSCLVVQL